MGLLVLDLAIDTVNVKTELDAACAELFGALEGVDDHLVDIAVSAFVGCLKISPFENGATTDAGHVVCRFGLIGFAEGLAAARRALEGHSTDGAHLPPLC
jgi:hypothetical protein